MVYGVMIAENF